jgi:hypothetical protein
MHHAACSGNQPHSDYSTIDIQENNNTQTDDNIPQNIDMSLGNGGCRLNKWHIETLDYSLHKSENADYTPVPESNHDAKLLTVLMKYPLLLHDEG